jgi:signal transduction histidine kinase
MAHTIVAGLLLCCAALPAHAAGDEAHVLMLYGVDPFIPTFLAMDKAMREDLAAVKGGNVLLFAESLDSQRFSLETLEPELAELFDRKYQAQHIDVVVAVSRTALEFFERHGEQIWPGARVVYVGFLGYEAGPPALPPGASAVLSILDVAGTIDIARRMQPGARRMVVVSGTAEIDRTAEQQAREALAKRQERVPVEYLTGLPLPELVARVAAEPPDSIVLFLTQFRDRDGRPYGAMEVARAVITASRAPAYGAAEPFIGLGVAAGSVSSYETKGRLIGEQVRRALAGGPPDARHIVLEAPNRCVVDARALKRWSLDARRVPSDCEVRFADVPIWRQYWRQIGLALAVILVQALLIGALLSQRRKRRFAEQAEHARRVELAHANRLAVAGELTGAIAHEINQPLGAILSNADAGELLLDSRMDKRDKLRDIFADIRRDDLRASEVIRRLRDLLGKHTVDRIELDLNDVVTDLQSILRAEARRRDLTLEMQLAQEPLPILGDRIQLQQVLINLALNAMDAVAGQPEARRSVNVSLEKSDRKAVLAVRDQGPGIAPEHRSKVFESFFTTKDSGMGLGLSITRTIVEAHGGRVWAESTSGEGTVFLAELPLIVAKGAASPQPA